jgi:hypothetical protein
MKQYQIVLDPEAPELTIRLPLAMIKDLMKRSTENGRDMNVELMMRLARTLENDLTRDEEDRLLAAECYFATNR